MSDDLTELTEYSPSDVAIIGLNGRFPGARNVQEFWTNLCNGVESISSFTDDELDASGVPPELRKRSNYVRARGILADVELFDANFFKISPREAEIMDPQQRIFLECAWEALESAGYGVELLPGRVGVYAGLDLNSYLLNNLYPRPEIINSWGPLQTAIGNDKDHLTLRVSHKFGLKGPSVTVQTTCSTGLVAVHLACQSLQLGECDMALAGAVAISVPQKMGYLFQESSITSPDGHCRAFDRRAQGTVFSNGVGIVVLKRLNDAWKDRDSIYAIIKGSAINNNGASRLSYTAPSAEGQAEVIAEALAMAQVDPETVSYIEAHGTGTPLGDPIEISALTRVFRKRTQKKRFCALGSVKTNIGHLNVATGMAGLIKTVLALKYQIIPPSLHFEKANPEIDLENSPFYVNTSPVSWPSLVPRRAGVSAFGIGGTNAHLVLEEPPLPQASDPLRPFHLLTLSAKTASALEVMVAQLAQYLRERPDLSFADIAYTLQVGRSAFTHRLALTCTNGLDAIQALETPDTRRARVAAPEREERPCVFMFPGQGVQYVNMGRGLYATEPGFRQPLDECCELLLPRLNIDLRQLLYPDPEQQALAQHRLEQTEISQPALFVVEYALAQLWMEWGVHPRAMIGHSLGEYVAACLAGVFSLEDALALLVTRGQLMASLPVGAMLAIPLPETDVLPFLQDGLSVAAINAPSLCVVSGSIEAVEALQTLLAKQGVATSRLHTSHAFHSAMVEPALPPFLEQVKRIPLRPPNIPFLSSVTGTWIIDSEAIDPVYWANHLRRTVRFAQGVRELLHDPDDVLLEIGPGSTLNTLVRQQLAPDSSKTILSSMRHPQESQEDLHCLLNTAGHLWLAGVSLDWSGFYSRERRFRAPLPTYPFERRRCWIDPVKDIQVHPAPLGPLPKQPDIANWFYVPSWIRTELPGPILKEQVADQPERVLIFADTQGIGTALAKRLTRAGRNVTTVGAGSQFICLSEAAYALDPSRPDDYMALMRELHRAQRFPHRVVHVWGVEPGGSTPGEFEHTQQLGFYSLLYLVQALGEQGPTEAVDLAVITSQVHGVTGDEELYPEKAMILGPCRVIPQEYPGIACRNIDIVIPRAGDAHRDIIVDQLVAELQASEANAIVAYRGRHRWRQTFESLPLAPQSEKVARLRENGVYLITGGLGGIGLTLAGYLARKTRAKLILTGRSAFPDRGEWDSWLAGHAESDSTSRKIRMLKEIEDQGAEVWIAGADVANAEQMKTVIGQAQRQFGQIHGVIHAAGLAGGELIQLDTAEAASAVIAPKVAGLRVLDELLGEEPLDFFVMCSSLSAILGGIGQMDYSAANAFLDAYAYWKTARSASPILSVAWDRWQEVGMAVNTTVSPQLEQWKLAALAQAITPAEGIEVFERLLNLLAHHVVVSTLNFRARLEQARATNPATRLRPNFSHDAAASRNETERELKLPEIPSAGYIAPDNEIEEIVAAVWRELLGLERIGVCDNFLELGGHSLMATQIVSRLRGAFGINLPLRHLLEAPTIRELSVVIEKMLIQEIADLEDEEAQRLLSSDS